MSLQFPTGALTFLFTDIEDSTRLWERHPEAMQAALGRHDQILREAIESQGGQVVKTTGDGAYAVFVSPVRALLAAVATQQALALTADRAATAAPPAADRLHTDPPLRIRVGLHTGEAELRDGDYHGTTLNRAARIMSSGHGGQILLSSATTALVADGLPSGISLRDLGEHRLRGLTRPERVYQVVIDGLPAEFPSLRTASARPVSLPQLPTGFIGRWEEVDEILQLLAGGARLVTLVGPGGMGKTRLAIQTAATFAERNAEHFPNGIFFVPLAPVSDPTRMLAVIAEVLEFRFDPGGRELRQQLLDYLRNRHALLVLDNMEQLLAGSGRALVTDILSTAPDVCLMATSRVRLGVHGESLYFVPGMRVPDAAAVRHWQDPMSEAEVFSALRLFVQTARRVRPGFGYTPDVIASVAHICRQLQGMPLAIELAAGWLEILTPPEIAAEIERSLDVLATDMTGVPDRQRSLRAVFETSWQLLNDRERSILPVLAVFRAPFSREAAEDVAGATLRDLLALSDKSWLQRTDADAGSARYQMHELLRQYAEDALRSDPVSHASVRRRYAHYYETWLQGIKPRLFGHEQREAIDTLVVEYPHLLAAWEQLIEEGAFERLFEHMLHPISRFTRMHGLVREAGHLFRNTIASCRRTPGNCSHRVLAALYVAEAMSHFGWADRSSAIEEAWQLAGQLEEPAGALGFWYVMLLRWRGERDQEAAGALRHLARTWDSVEHNEFAHYAWLELGDLLAQDADDRQQLLEAAEWLRRAGAAGDRLGDSWFVAQAFRPLAFVLAYLDNHAEAFDLMTRAEDSYRMLGDWPHEMWIRLSRGHFYLNESDGRVDLFLSSFDEPIAISHARGDRLSEALMIGNQSTETVRYGNIDRALALRQQSLALTRELGFDGMEPWELWEMGEIYRVAGSVGDARRYYDQARTLFRKIDHWFGLAYCERGYADIALAGGDYQAAAARFRASFDFIQRRPIEYWSHIYVLIGQARALTGLGRPVDALASLHDAIQIARKPMLESIKPVVIIAVVELSLATGHAELAAALCGLLIANPITWNETRAQARKLAETSRTVLGDDVAGAAEARGQKLTFRKFIDDVAHLSSEEPDAWLAAAGRLAGLVDKDQPRNSGGKP